MLDKKSQADLQLKKMYRQWLAEINQMEPDFLTNDDYSNPYFSCVPKNWFENDTRILIVGEEGFGQWGRGKEDGISPYDIDSIQTFCWSSLASYLDYDLEYDLYPNASRYKNRYSAFWNRARRLSELGICGWTNIDLIHHRANSSKKCALTSEERIKLHSTHTRILAEQVKILEPTHVVYAGWYGDSLKYEFPELYMKLYPNGKDDYTVWKNKVVSYEYEGVKHIFAYHPNWGIRRAGYEDKVINEIKI